MNSDNSKSGTVWNSHTLFTHWKWQRI